MLLAAIDAAASIRPHEAAKVLGGFMDSDDEDIVEAAYDAMSMLESPPEEGDDDYED